MKKEYDIPEFELIKISLVDKLLTPSQYNHYPEVPERDGDEGGDGNL